MSIKLLSYLRLIRFFNPTGTILLALPCMWSAHQNIRLCLIFLLGAFVMRSAGCIINDILDIDIDRQVERTKSRPIANGEISITRALILLAILLLIGSQILLCVKMKAIICSLGFFLMAIIYPLAKRVMWGPQFFLGLTYSSGVIIGSIAFTDQFDPRCILLYMCSVFWVAGYDTIYAMQDADDDSRIGIGSIAVKFRKNPLFFISCLYFISILFLGSFGMVSNFSFMFYIINLLTIMTLSLQIYLAHRFKKYMLCFKSNSIAGILILISIISSG